MSQLSLGSAGLGQARLSCGHDPVAVDLDALARTKDGWYEAVPCPVCRRRRAVVSVGYPTPSDASARLRP